MFCPQQISAAFVNLNFLLAWFTHSVNCILFDKTKKKSINRKCHKQTRAGIQRKRNVILRWGLYIVKDCVFMTTPVFDFILRMLIFCSWSVVITFLIESFCSASWSTNTICPKKIIFLPIPSSPTNHPGLNTSCSFISIRKCPYWI